MNVRSINWLPLLLLIGIAGLSVWLERAAQDGYEKPATRTTGVDFWAENFNVRRFGSDGKLQSVLVANRLTHESADDSSVLIEPRMSFIRVPPLTVASTKGLIDSGGETIELIGDVQLNREARPKSTGSDKDPLLVRTERMTIYPDRDQTEGHVPVRIDRGRSVITASSFKTDGKTGVSIIEGRVRATIHNNDS